MQAQVDYGLRLAQASTDAQEEYDRLVTASETQWAKATEAEKVAADAMELVQAETPKVTSLCTDAGLDKLAEALTLTLTLPMPA